MHMAVSMDRAGRVLLPASVRDALGLKPGSRLILDLEDQVITLTPTRETIRRAQAILAPYRPKDGRLISEELIADRRAEAARECE